MTATQPNPYRDTYVTRLEGGKVRVDSPGGHAIYDCTRVDTFDRFPLVHGSSNQDRRDCVNAYIASLSCDACVGILPPDDDGTPGGWDHCGRPAVILLIDASTWPVCARHNT